MIAIPFEPGSRSGRTRPPSAVTLATSWRGAIWPRSSGSMGASPMSLVVTFGPEAGAINPHPVQDHADTSCKGNHRSFGPAATGNLRTHARSHVDRPRCIMTVAAWHNARRRFTSPALVIPPETSRSPDWLREGVKPTQGPTFFEDVKRAGSSTADR